MATQRLRAWLNSPPLGRRAAMLTAPAFVAGAAAYIAWPDEPHLLPVAASALAAAALAVFCRRIEGLRWPSMWLAAAAIGFLWAMLSTNLADAPRLTREGAGELTGVADWIEAGDKRPRLELKQAVFERRGRRVALKRARVRLAAGPRPEIGDRVKVRAVMRPPPDAVAPGAYDFARDAYFKGIGAVGFAIGPAEVTATTGRGGLSAVFGRMRTGIRDAVYRALPDRPETAGVIAALTVGDRSGVSADDNAALRASGLAHLLAISGLHLGMAAAWVYLGLRLLFALPHGLALRAPTHKIAAAIAILAALLYLGLSGAAPPAQRAFVMAAAGMIAVMTDRLRSGLWFVAWAAVLVTAYAPHVVVGPSFQLSFAAATAIVAAYEAASARRRTREAPVLAEYGPLRPILTYVGGIAGASLIATAATAPLALAHFQQAPALGVIANLAAMPAMAIVIMPAAILAGVAAPFGLAEWPLMAMAVGVEAVLAVAHWIAAWPIGVIRAPATPDWVVFCFLAGGVLTCVLRGWPRWAALLGPILAIVGIAAASPPDLLVSEGGRLAAVAADGKLYATSDRLGRFEREVWRRHVGAGDVETLAKTDPPWATCDDRGCVATIHGRVAALSFEADGLPADCRRADLVVVLNAGRIDKQMGCRQSLPVIDGGDLAVNGAHAIWLSADGPPRVETVRDRHGGRPWSSRRPGSGR